MITPIYNKVYSSLEENVPRLFNKDNLCCLNESQKNFLIKKILHDIFIYKNINYRNNLYYPENNSFKNLEKRSKEYFIEKIHKLISTINPTKQNIKQLLMHVSTFTNNEIIFLEEMTMRVKNDMKEIKSKFELHSFELIDIEITEEEAHENGRNVCFLVFKDKNDNIKNVMYKPRDSKAELVILNDENSIFAENNLPTLKVLSKPGYGYFEYITHEQKFNQSDKEDNEENLITEFTKTLVICAKYNIADLISDNFICSKHKGKLKLILIDAEVINNLFKEGKKPKEHVYHAFHEMMNKEINRNMKKCSRDYMHADELGIFNKILKETINLSTVSEKYKNQLSDSLRRIIPISTENYINFREQFLKKRYKEPNNDIIETCLTDTVQALFKWCSIHFSKEDIGKIRIGIEQNFLSERKSIPRFCYCEERKQIFFHGEWIGSSDPTHREKESSNNINKVPATQSKKNFYTNKHKEKLFYNTNNNKQKSNDPNSYSLLNKKPTKPPLKKPSYADLHKKSSNKIGNLNISITTNASHIQPQNLSKGLHKKSFDSQDSKSDATYFSKN